MSDNMYVKTTKHQRQILDDCMKVLASLAEIAHQEDDLATMVMAASAAAICEAIVLHGVMVTGAMAEIAEHRGDPS